MKCKVQGVYKNPRYRILIIDEQKYILDMGTSFWKILNPLFFWIFPNTAFKVNDQEVVEKLKTPEVKQTKTGWAGVFAGGVGVLLANLLRPLANLFNIPSSPFVNSIIVMLVLIIVFSFYFYINKRSKKNLYQVVELEQLPTKRLWIRPKTYKYFFQLLFSYLLFLGLTVLSLGGFIQLANVMVLFFGMVFLFFLLFISFFAVVGHMTVTFKADKKAVV